jgi:hypothetical protein
MMRLAKALAAESLVDGLHDLWPDSNGRTSIFEKLGSTWSCATWSSRRVLELDAPDGRECLGGGFDAGDAVDPVAAKLPSVVDHEQDDVAVAGPPE